MGWFSKVLKLPKRIVEQGIVDPFLGGAERKAAKQAAEGQKAAGNTWDQYGSSLNYDPYIQAGNNALDQYTQNLQQPAPFSYTGQDLYNDPSYQFRLNEGLNAINRAGGAAGSRISGNRLLDLNNYAQGMASTEFQNAYGRAKDTYGTNYNVLQDWLTRMGEMANFGYGAQLNADKLRLAATEGKTGTQTAAANALAAGGLGSANAARGTANMLIGLFGSKGK